MSEPDFTECDKTARFWDQWTAEDCKRMAAAYLALRTAGQDEPVAWALPPGFSRLHAAAYKFRKLVQETNGRIPTERLSFADWHELCKAHDECSGPPDAPAPKGEQFRAASSQGAYLTRRAVTVEEAMTREQIEQLMKFYAVDTLEALVEAQARHIEKLQAKLPPNDISARPISVRKG